MTQRSDAMGYARRKEQLHRFISGWMNYFKLADMAHALRDVDAWLRRRIRMCIWKSWKTPKTRIRNMLRCGVSKHFAYGFGYTKGYWRAAGSIMQRVATNEKLLTAGYPTLLGYYVKLHQR